MVDKIISGKRKTSIAKVRIKSGTGKVTYNRKPADELGLFHRLSLLEPIKIYEKEFGKDLKNDFHIKTMGGGKESQIQAARLALAKSLIHVSGSDVLKKVFLKYDRYLIVQDSRRKETRKPGDSSARANRQTSYR